MTVAFDPAATFPITLGQDAPADSQLKFHCRRLTGREWLELAAWGDDEPRLKALPDIELVAELYNLIGKYVRVEGAAPGETLCDVLCEPQAWSLYWRIRWMSRLGVEEKKGSGSQSDGSTANQVAALAPDGQTDAKTCQATKAPCACHAPRATEPTSPATSATAPASLKLLSAHCDTLTPPPGSVSSLPK